MKTLDLFAAGGEAHFQFEPILIAGVRFSNRPAGVKHLQAVRHNSVDLTRGLVLLYGIGTSALPSWDSKTRWNNL